mmetsp:Transcript_39680/g.67638  ORF Transcript_39680/g.67638 Transcript_39680/m.67638 type:complete len:160 (-) Transcript_39680:234-713(-)|eukprot:CAMPEP_0183788000 /NCGR_PEP_ID=MMETSP0739-20130205/67832_1 /TAXON_ID=385413 /ORGANISM="Thalassiosira miniscula, Strain CCMP1093" /LENGTH=159 /DNA_ID=CAMNT_0026032097 /DNA_START=136 /DNA_END=615 /DNA_ORIENTATION=-
MRFKYLHFIGKPRRKKSKEYQYQFDMDKAVHIPNEIFVLNESVKSSKAPRHQWSKTRHTVDGDSYCEKQNSRGTPLLSPMTVSTANSRDDVEDAENSSSARFSDDSTGIRNDLWEGATATNGPIKDMDKLCNFSVVQIMSRSDAFQKKMLDDFLNHGEF